MNHGLQVHESFGLHDTMERWILATAANDVSRSSEAASTRLILAILPLPALRATRFVSTQCCLHQWARSRSSRWAQRLPLKTA